MSNVPSGSFPVGGIGDTPQTPLEPLTIHPPEQQAQPLTIHTPKQQAQQSPGSSGRRDMAVQEVSSPQLKNIGSPRSPKPLPSVSKALKEMQAEPLSASKSQSWLESPEIRKLIGSKGVSNIKELIKERGEQWAEKVKEELESVQTHDYHVELSCFTIEGKIIPGGLLGAAIYCNKPELVQFLCAAGPSGPPSEDYFRVVGLENNLMNMSVKRGNVDIVKALIQLFPYHFELALAAATRVGNVNMVNILLKEDVCQEKDVFMALLVASKNSGNIEIMNSLLKAIDSKEGVQEFIEYIFLNAAREGKVEIINTLLEFLLAEDVRKKSIGEILIKIVKEVIVNFPQLRDFDFYGFEEEGIDEFSKSSKFQKKFERILNAILKVAEPEDIGKALIEVAKINGINEIAELFFAAGVKDKLAIDTIFTALEEAQNVGNTDFMNLYWLSQLQQTEEGAENQES